jgi:hypothetical protein
LNPPYNDFLLHNRIIYNYFLKKEQSRGLLCTIYLKFCIYKSFDSSWLFWKYLNEWFPALLWFYTKIVTIFDAKWPSWKRFQSSIYFYNFLKVIWVTPALCSIGFGSSAHNFPRGCEFWNPWNFVYLCFTL